MATDLSDGELAQALKARLRPLLPWWFGFDVTLEREQAEVSYRVFRFGFRSSWGRRGWGRPTDPTDPDFLSLTDEVAEILIAIQEDVWGAKHRTWPVRNAKLGPSCPFDSLPKPHAEARGHTLHVSFPAVGVTPPPIELSRNGGD